MKTVFLTGATGFIGEQLTRTLSAQGVQVRGLVRNPDKLNALPDLHLEPVAGTLDDPKSLERGMEGCLEAYHIAALASAWHPDPQAFHQTNVLGTQNFLEAAHQAGIRRVVLTSTAGVMGPTPNGRLVNEATNPAPILTTEYERTKRQAEVLAQAFGEKTGLEIVVVNPSRVYGPGQASESAALNKMFQQYAAGKWRIIPGNGNSVGNYVFIDDVVQGHLLAMAHGKPGERYILGGENYSFNQLFALLAELTQRRYRMLHFPLPVMLGIAHTQQFLADTLKLRPLITPPFVRKYLNDWPLSSQKAEQELGYQITPLPTGLEATLRWLAG